MSAHFSETDLLEIHYLEREEELPVAEHLAGCTRCAEQLERTRELLRRGADVQEPDDTFFERQRHAVMRRLHDPVPAGARAWRYAAAAAIVLTISGTAAYRVAAPVGVPQTTTTASAATTASETVIPRDVWETDALEEFQPLVDWQSWEEAKISKGDRS